jgi:hypothetical protein
VAIRGAADECVGRIGLLRRGNPNAENKLPAENNPMSRMFEALARLHVAPEPVVYSDDVVEEVRNQLLQLDGVLVWVDPITPAGDRSKLDALLRDVSSNGVWVSAHPDVILKMGTKEVIFRTRELSWGTDTYLYDTVEEFRAQFPLHLASAGPRVLKQNRGNGGIGVWKIELTARESARLETARADAVVRVLHAQRDSVEEEMELSDFMHRCEAYFARSGRMVDQAFQARLPEGMIRCYLAQDKVVGFGQQLIRALMPPLPEGASPDAAQPGPRVMHGASAPAFQSLRMKMESEWIPAMRKLLHVDRNSLPVIWDADFLYGPKTPSGEDTYVLCEINVSAVFPFPDEAVQEVAQAAVSCMLAARTPRV